MKSSKWPKNVLMICGGPSGEHPVSLTSARHVSEHLKAAGFEVSYLGIDRKGIFRQLEDQHLSEKEIPLTAPNISPSEALLKCDVVFPLVHGRWGEDGLLPSLCELYQKPYVGSGPEASMVAFNKVLTKVTLERAGLLTTPWASLRSSEKAKSFQEYQSLLESDQLFVKPAREGSSLGVGKIKTQADLEPALNAAFTYDDLVLIEAAVVQPQEIECAILDGQASVPGEIEVRSEFYDYATKYINSDAAVLHLPARLSQEQSQEVQELSIRAFESLSLRQYARIDFFRSSSSGKLTLNEVNTVPGFTPISMYPKMMQATGVDYQSLVTQLVTGCL